MYIYRKYIFKKGGHVLGKSPKFPQIFGVKILSKKSEGGLCSPWRSYWQWTTPGIRWRWMTPPPQTQDFTARKFGEQLSKKMAVKTNSEYFGWWIWSTDDMNVTSVLYIHLLGNIKIVRQFVKPIWMGEARSTKRRSHFLFDPQESLGLLVLVTLGRGCTWRNLTCVSSTSRSVCSIYCWWFRNPANQLRSVVHPTYCIVFSFPSEWWWLDFFININNNNNNNNIIIIIIIWLGQVSTLKWKWHEPGKAWYGGCFRSPT